jgi:hypothetical protein
MQIKDGIIEFKSAPANYYAERDGTKPNTVRIFSDHEDDRYDLAARQVSENRRELVSGKDVIDKIVIINSKTGAQFTRTLTDVTVCVLAPSVVAWVFSWIPVDNTGKYLYSLRDLL